MLQTPERVIHEPVDLDLPYGLPHRFPEQSVAISASMWMRTHVAGPSRSSVQVDSLRFTGPDAGQLNEKPSPSSPLYFFNSLL